MLNPSCFPCTGMVGASVVVVLEYILPSYQGTLGVIASCTKTNCIELTHLISADLNFDLPAICSLLQGVIEQDTVDSLQHWLDLWIQAEARKLESAVQSSTCRSSLCD